MNGVYIEDHWASSTEACLEIRHLRAERDQAVADNELLVEQNANLRAELDRANTALAEAARWSPLVTAGGAS